MAESAARRSVVAVPRHFAFVRVTHWITTLSFFALLVSGVEILISHPRFYWGEAGNVNTPALFQLPIPASRGAAPTGYGYVLPDQNGWSRYLHFQAAWAAVLTGLGMSPAVAADRPSGLCAGPCSDGVSGWVLESRARDDHGPTGAAAGGSMSGVSRRKLIVTGLGAVAGVTGLVAAGKLAQRFGVIPPDGGGLYGPGETLTYAAHRALARSAQAREFRSDQISKKPFANEVAPLGDPFKRLQQGGFAEWRLAVDGMVERPGPLSVAELRSFPWRSQITHLACEEGWSYIAEWKGGDLPAGFGGPLRLRVPRQLGYKSVKYLTSLTVTDSLKRFGKGLGSASPEGGYAWYAGI